MEPCFLYQRQLGERVSTARCQARWWMVLLNLLRRCCIIVCHCSESSYLLGQGCHRHHIASTPDFSPPLCGLSTSPTFCPSLCLSHHPGGFGTMEYFFCFLEGNKTELVSLSNILCSLYPELGRATSCFLFPCTSAWEHLDSVGLSTSSRATITLSPSDTSHLLPASQNRKKSTLILHIKIRQQIDFNYGWSETKYFIRCGGGETRGEEEEAAGCRGLETEVDKLEAG